MGWSTANTNSELSFSWPSKQSNPGVCSPQQSRAHSLVLDEPLSSGGGKGFLSHWGCVPRSHSLSSLLSWLWEELGHRVAACLSKHYSLSAWPVWDISNLYCFPSVDTKERWGNHSSVQFYYLVYSFLHKILNLVSFFFCYLNQRTKPKQNSVQYNLWVKFQIHHFWEKRGYLSAIFFFGWLFRIKTGCIRSSCRHN